MRNQTGFGAIQILLVFVLIGMIGGTGYYVWQNRNLDASTADNSINQKEASDESADDQQETTSKHSFLPGENTYTLPKEKLNVKFTGSDWDEIEPTTYQEGNFYSESLYFRNKDFSLSLVLGADGKGGFHCYDLADYNPKTCYSESKVLDSIELNGQKLNIVAHMHKEPDSIKRYTLYLTDKDNCKVAFSCSLPTKVKFVGYVAFAGGFDSDQEFPTISEFTETDEVKRSINIMKSLSY